LKKYIILKFEKITYKKEYYLKDKLRMNWKYNI